MEIDRTITNIWTVRVSEADVFNRFTDEAIQEEKRRNAGKTPSVIVSEDDKAILHRYYCASLAELSAVMAKRTRRVGGSIVNSVDQETRMLTTVYTLAMTDNHESELIHALGAHCLEFLVARLLEKWYGHGSDFGSDAEKGQVRDTINYRRACIERPIRPI